MVSVVSRRAGPAVTARLAVDGGQWPARGRHEVVISVTAGSGQCHGRAGRSVVSSVISNTITQTRKYITLFIESTR